ncbi:MAG: NAD(P)H:quinone oxidoreductase [Patescibacteria group bacterium]
MPKKKIIVLFYSFTGGTAALAREVAKGASGFPDISVEIKRIPETLPDSFFDDKPDLKKRRQKFEKEFSVATIDDLLNADGVALGTPVHFGSFASQVKQFIDQLSPIWIEGKLVNKPAALFCSSGSVHGGEELTLISMMIPLLNLGMIPVGIPYPIQGTGSDFDAGSPYGAIFVTGHKGEKKMSSGDKKVAQILGRRLATMTQIMNCSCKKCTTCTLYTKKLS